MLNVALISSIIMGLQIAAGLQHFKVEGRSMLPVLTDGQIVAVCPVDQCKIQNRSIIVFRGYTKGSPLSVKMVVGQPGEYLAFDKLGHMYIEDQPVKNLRGDLYVIAETRRAFVRRYEGELSGYWVIGAPDALDSADIGWISENRVLGVVRRHLDTNKQGLK